MNAPCQQTAIDILIDAVQSLVVRVQQLEAARATAQPAPQTPAGGVGEPAPGVSLPNSAGGGLTNPAAGSFEEEVVTDEMVAAGTRELASCEVDIAWLRAREVVWFVYRAMRAAAPRTSEFLRGCAHGLDVANKQYAIERAHAVQEAAAPAGDWARGAAAYREGKPVDGAPTEDWRNGWHDAQANDARRAVALEHG